MQIPASARELLAAAGVGYLLGTLPSADVAAAIAAGGTVDLRTAGHRNPGAANAFQVLGLRYGLSVLAADVAKAGLAAVVGRRRGGATGAHVAAVGAVAGHCYPVWRRFRGGVGVAPSLGQCLATFPAYAPLDVAVATAVAAAPGVRKKVFTATAAASACWVLAGVVWWRRGWRNLWGPAPSAALPLANGASTLLILSRFAVWRWSS